MPSFLAIASANRLVSPVSMTTIVDVSFFRAMPLFERFLETAFFPQLLFWVGFTIRLDTIRRECHRFDNGPCAQSDRLEAIAFRIQGLNSRRFLSL